MNCSTSRLWKLSAAALAAGVLLCTLCVAQDTSAKPADRVIGTVTATDSANHTVTVKEDKTGTGYVVQLANTKTLLKVEPGAKDLKSATRITADDLAVGDRVQVGGSKVADNGTTLAARSVILMSARDLQQLHQAQSAAWQHSTPGVVTGVDEAMHSLNVSARTPQGPKTIVVDASKADFTRYSPETPKNPVASQLADIEPGDQIRIIGAMSPDGASLSAQKIYSSSFRTVVGTISSIAADTNQITVKNLQTKQTMTVKLGADAAVRRLPPMMAYMLARRFNPDFRPPQGADASSSGGASGASRNGGTAPSNGANPADTEAASQAGGRGNWDRGGTGGNGPGGLGTGFSGGMRGNGDLSQMLDRLPKIGVTDLKPGDAVVISGSPVGTDNNELLATTVIAGVEPIFQSASPRQAQSLGDWGASLSGGEAEAAGAPGGPPQ